MRDAPYTQWSLLERLDRLGGDEDVELDAEFDAPLAAELVDRRRMPTGSGSGAARLLRELVKRGLPEDALKQAAALCLLLDEPRDCEEAA